MTFEYVEEVSAEELAEWRAKIVNLDDLTEYDKYFEEALDEIFSRGEDWVIDRQRNILLTHMGGGSRPGHIGMKYFALFFENHLIKIYCHMHYEKQSDTDAIRHFSKFRRWYMRGSGAGLSSRYPDYLPSYFKDRRQEVEGVIQEVMSALVKLDPYFLANRAVCHFDDTTVDPSWYIQHY